LPKRRKRRLLILSSCGGLLVLIAAYAHFVEPFWIEVTHHYVSAPLKSPLKIAQLTDLHTAGRGRCETRMLDILEAEKPDAVVITGDSVSHNPDYNGWHEVLKLIHAPLGVWVVRGNHEDWWPVANERDFYESAGAKVLVNSSAQVRDDVWFVGLDDLFGGSPDVNAALEGVPADAFKIALFHSPNYFGKVAGRCQVALAGHTHGGQVRLPFIPPFWVPPESGDYLEGWFENGGSRMYVSRGLGMSILPVRFCCRPEIAIFTFDGNSAAKQ
jgi:uncharacterized protein